MGRGRVRRFEFEKVYQIKEMTDVSLVKMVQVFCQKCGRPFKVSENSKTIFCNRLCDDNDPTDYRRIALGPICLKK